MTSTDPQVTLRDLRVPGDFAAAIAVRNAASPEWPTTAEALARSIQQRDPAHFHADVVAERGGQVVGVGSVGHDAHSFEAWRYWGGLFVHPDARQRGVGAALYAELLRRLRSRGAREARTMLSSRPADAPGRAFLEARGWQVAWERYESELNTADLDLDTFGPLLEGVAARGIRLVSLAELAADPQRDRQLHELDWALVQDIPSGTPLTKRPLEQWVTDELGDPQLRPALSFVAVQDGLNDPLTGDYVGYSTLGYNSGGPGPEGQEPDGHSAEEHGSGGFYYIGMTGVRRAVRGQGVAKALKVAAMRALRDQTSGASGDGRIRTFNDKPNQAMLGMNAALGFRRTATLYRYELKLDALEAQT